ncbi:butyryl-CoA dehydrogenase [Anopheles sinensis]|uniref:Butyryl-CoA dehydrogenase n=1 Tax=Anopheles sinensis TaxID=74873 RepID=A0A084VR69_ANOSI|nr:butyryl-CoA dehydrogenase [Anopheles sinensis]
MSNEGERMRGGRIEPTEMASPPSIRGGVGTTEGARMADSRSTPDPSTIHHSPREQNGQGTGPSQEEGHPEAGSKENPISAKRRQIELTARELEWQMRELAFEEERRAYELERNVVASDTQSTSLAEMRKADEWLDTTDRCGEVQRGVGFPDAHPVERGFSEWRRMMEASAGVNRHSE